MNIGILTYHWVPNFGAQMQTMATVLNVKKNGHNPVIINWLPAKTEENYRRHISQEQYKYHQEFVDQYFVVTRPCETQYDIAEEIKRNDIELVIIGSDSVLNVQKCRYSLLTRKKTDPTPDHVFPNPFWGTFLDQVKVPLVALAVSSQNANYRQFYSEREAIGTALKRFSFITVRDTWTASLVSYFTQGQCVPAVIPDPVFSFNDGNPPHITKEAILRQYNLPEKYILLSFGGGLRSRASKKWVSQFQALAQQDHISCVEFPRPAGAQALDVAHRVELPLRPLDWYYLIKYASGYVGQLMHPIVVALHNTVPCFSYDHYGVPTFGGVHNLKRSSKIYTLLDKFSLLDNYFNISDFYKQPSPERVYSALKHFDKHAVKQISEYQSAQLHNYLSALISIVHR